MNVEEDVTGKKIIAATFKLLQEEGVQKTTTKKIAVEAGVNEVTVFRKFGNKNALVEATKEYYLNELTDKLEEIFDFKGDEEIDEYLKINFFGLLVLSEDDFSIMKVAMEEVREVPDRPLLMSQIIGTIVGKLEEFFTLQLEKGKIREVNPRSLSLLIFSILFQSVILSKIYNRTPTHQEDFYADEFLDILFKGINPEESVD